MADIAAGKGLWVESLGHLQMAMAMEDPSVQDYLTASELSILSGNNGGAVEYCRSAVALEPGPVSYGGLGEAYFAVEEIDSALHTQGLEVHGLHIGLPLGIEALHAVQSGRGEGDPVSAKESPLVLGIPLHQGAERTGGILELSTQWAMPREEEGHDPEYHRGPGEASDKRREAGLSHVEAPG